MDKATIDGYFQRYGWSFEYDEEARVWHTGFRGEVHNFAIFVSTNDNWIIFSITPFVVAADSEVCRAKLHMFLLQLNFAINLAKFSIDPEGDVVLTVELPTEEFNYSLFEDGLNAVSFYADSHFLDVLNVAKDPDYVPSSLDDGWSPPTGDMN